MSSYQRAPATAPAARANAERSAPASLADAMGVSARGQSREISAALAAAGAAGATPGLPHGDLIAAAFGRFAPGAVRTRIGGDAALAAKSLGARAYAHGDTVAFASTPDLHTVAHEAAHVVQQSAGADVERHRDALEAHADAVADQVVGSGSAEALLSQIPGGGRAGGQAAAVQFDAVPGGELSSSEVDRITAWQERTGVWDRHTLDGPVAARPDGDADVLAAQSALASLRLPPEGVTALRTTLGLRPRPAVLERSVAEAFLAWRRSDAAAAAAAAASHDEANTPTSDATPAAATDERAAATGSESARPEPLIDAGVLNRLNLGYALARDTRLRTALAWYVSGPLFATSTGAQATAWAEHINTALGASASPLTHGRRGWRATRAFIGRVITWQLGQSTGATPDGRLTSADLRSMGLGDVPDVALDAPTPTAAGASSTTTAPGTAAGAESPDTAASETEAPPSPAVRQAALEGIVSEVGAYLRTRQATFRATRHDPEARATRSRALDEAFSRQLDQCIAALAAADDGADLTAFERRTNRVGLETVRNWAFRCRVAAEALLHPAADAAPGASIAAPEPDAGVTATDAFLDGLDDEAATDWLAGEGVLTGAAPLVQSEAMGGWNPRLVAAGAEEMDPRDRAGQALGLASGEAADRTIGTTGHDDVGEAAPGTLPAVRRSIAARRTVLDALVRGTDAAALRRELSTLPREDWRPPSVVRRPLVFHWPRESVPAPGVPNETSRLRALGRQWLAAMRAAVNDIRLTERRQAGYTRAAPRVNPDAVFVDLNLTGVDVLWGTGSPVPRDQMHLDPVFAAAMVQFLRGLRGLGVTRLYTAGFLRTAMSSLDAHPTGHAVDLTGFEFGGALLHLRSGLPAAEDRGEAYEGRVAPAGREDLHRGPSDYYNTRDRLGERTHREIMLGIVSLMRGVFTRVVGPGHDAQHNAHFHCERTGAAAARTEIHVLEDPLHAEASASAAAARS
ncbi:DUF4157 domain-containing protein [Myxococcota bacterium]|nr:DUF4157 domain-containing protein [Myxococcota bacterium]